MKETRALFWPWILVTSIGALAWLLRVQSDEFDFSPGFWLGIPLLATLSLGAEFHSRTFDLLLSQPAARSRMWMEKFAVAIVAALSSSVFYWLTWQEGFAAPAALWMVITVCSATFWTLVARSTTGGLILNLFQIVFLVFAVIVVPHAFGFEGRPIAPTAASPFAVAGALFYAALMLWLGVRKFSSFQVAGRFAGNDILAASPNVAPGTVAGLLQSRPRQPVLNLIRKEVRLLWPVWLLTVFAMLFLVLMTPFRSMTSENPGFVNPPELAFSLIGVYALLAAILAGVLSMGEERTGGTFSWHVTLPISLRRQWFIKLAMAMLSSFICIRLVLTIGSLLLGGPFDNLANELQYVIMGGGAALTFAAFWSTCVIRGTVAAALWAFPAAAVVFVAGPAGMNLLEWAKDAAIFNFLVSRLPPFTGTYTFSTDSVMFAILVSGGTALTWLSVPSILLALIQSHRLFRREAGDSGRPIVRHLVPLVVVGALVGTLTATPVVLGYQTHMQSEAILRETHLAIRKSPVLPTDPANLALSNAAMRWLKGGNISMTAQNQITIQFRNGWQCTERTQRQNSRIRGASIFYWCISSKGRTPVIFDP